MKNTRLLILLLIISSCSSLPEDVKYAYRAAGKNKAELKKVIANYQDPKDSMKLKAAYFLIGSLPDKYHYTHEPVMDTFCIKVEELKKKGEIDVHNKSQMDSLLDLYISETYQKDLVRDIDVITADVLIENIDMAFFVWDSLAWNNHLNFDQFCEYILPYKCSFLKPQQWRKKLFDRYQWVLDSIKDETDPVEAATWVSQELKTWYKYSYLGARLPADIDQIFIHGNGMCQHSTPLAVYTMRAIGIPVKIAQTVKIGIPPTKGVHLENIILTKDAKLIKFQGGDVAPLEEPLWPDAFDGKWYSVLYKKNSHWITEYVTDINQVPVDLRNSYQEDITREVSAVSDLKMKLKPPAGNYENTNEFVFLCFLARQGEWLAIDFAKIENDSIIFRNVEPGYVYFPMYYNYGKYSQCADPFFLNQSGELLPIVGQSEGETQNLKLYRKYPLKERPASWSAGLIGCEIEASNTKDFSVSTVLHTIKDSTLHIMDIAITNPERYKYLRFSCNNNFHPSKYLAELQIYGINYDREARLDGKLFFPPGINYDFIRGAKDGFDNDWLSRADLNEKWRVDGELWIGFEIEEPARITRLRYISRSDMNCIVPGDTYALYYLNNASWQHIGTKIAETHHIEFLNVPNNKIYMLRNNTRGKEEYTFTYSNNKQIWW